MGHPRGHWLVLKASVTLPPIAPVLQKDHKAPDVAVIAIQYFRVPCDKLHLPLTCSSALCHQSISEMASSISNLWAISNSHHCFLTTSYKSVFFLLRNVEFSPKIVLVWDHRHAIFRPSPVLGLRYATSQLIRVWYEHSIVPERGALRWGHSSCF